MNLSMSKVDSVKLSTCEFYFIILGLVKLSSFEMTGIRDLGVLFWVLDTFVGGTIEVCFISVFILTTFGGSLPPTNLFLLDYSALTQLWVFLLE